MPVLGAVLTLSDEPALRDAIVDTLGADVRVTLGDATGNRLPVVLETDSRGEDKACWEAVTRLPGVMHVELAFADFSDLHEPAQADGAP